MEAGSGKLLDLPPTSRFISEEYRQEQRRLHETTDYGTASAMYAPMVAGIIERMGVTHLLDYGCGANCTLAKSLKVPHKVKYQAYDPAVARFSSDPVPAELVCCIDVLEHIEPDRISAVLDHLAALTEAVGFFTVSTGPALKTLSDGRNAHLIQQPPEWWLPQIMDRFELQTFMRVADDAFLAVVYSKSKIEAPDGKKLSA